MLYCFLPFLVIVTLSALGAELAEFDIPPMSQVLWRTEEEPEFRRDYSELAGKTTNLEGVFKVFGVSRGTDGNRRRRKKREMKPKNAIPTTNMVYVKDRHGRRKPAGSDLEPFFSVFSVCEAEQKK